MTIRLVTGMRFGRLILRRRRTVQKAIPNLKEQWSCECDCGTQLVVPKYYLIRKVHPKMNCGNCPDLKTSKTIHHNVYTCWYMMQVRCYDSRHRHYKNYGGRGIKVCDEWRDPNNGFDAFLAHIGPRPSPTHSVDRYPDPDGNYAPGNVRWATPEQQANNKSKLKGTQAA